MSVTDDDLRAIWQHGSTDVPSNRSACLSEVEWARLLTKDANEEERARAADHIGTCMECAEECRLLLPLQSWATELQQALPRDNKVLSYECRPASTGWRQWLAMTRPALAHAALAVLIVMQAVGLYFIVGTRRQNAQLEAQLGQERQTLSSTQKLLTTLQEELRRRPAPEQLAALPQLARLSAPQLDVPIFDLDPHNIGSVRGSAEPQVVTPDPDASFVTLILHFAPLMSRSTLEVEVTAESGQTPWVSRTAREPSTASLTLALPTDSYPPGRYEVRVFDVTRARTLLATYAVIIRASSAKGP